MKRPTSRNYWIGFSVIMGVLWWSTSICGPVMGPIFQGILFGWMIGRLFYGEATVEGQREREQEMLGSVEGKLDHFSRITYSALLHKVTTEDEVKEVEGTIIH